MSDKKTGSAEEQKNSSAEAPVRVARTDVVYKLRDLNSNMVESWKEVFENKDYHGGKIQVSQGDIFKGGPEADALVSPANSFGFMDGGIDMVISQHVGWQLQGRLQKVIQTKHEGELLVGKAEIVPMFEPGQPPSDETRKQWKGCNEGKPIKFLISAPTMRVPQDVSNTSNAYLAFRAIILAVDEHNKNPSNEPIRSVLCPGLGTAVGRMPQKRCAFQMSEAYCRFAKGDHVKIQTPEHLEDVWLHDQMMQEYGHGEARKSSKTK